MGNHGAAADIRVRSDAHELMHGAQSAHYSPLFDRHVTAQSGPIDQHGMIGHRAVVANVGVSHEQNMTAYARDAATFDRAAIDGHELTNFVVLAYLQAGGLPLVRNILRRHTDGAKREKLIVGADFRWTLDGDMRNQPTTFAQLNVSADHAIGTDLA